MARIKDREQRLVDDGCCLRWIVAIRYGEELLCTQTALGDLLPGGCCVLLRSFSWELGELRVVGGALLKRPMIVAEHRVRATREAWRVHALAIAPVPRVEAGDARLPLGPLEEALKLDDDLSGLPVEGARDVRRRAVGWR